MFTDSDAAAEFYWKRFGYIPMDGAHLRDDPVLFLARNVKDRLKHDRKWIYHNNHTELAPPIWSIISDYWSEDPRIVDVILYRHSVAKSDDSLYISELGFDSRLLMYNYVDVHLAFIDAHISTVDRPCWLSRDDDVMTSYLIMPTMNADWSESENVCANPHVPWVRNYLYWRLEHPDDAPKSDDESDY